MTRQRVFVVITDADQISVTEGTTAEMTFDAYSSIKYTIECDKETKRYQRSNKYIPITEAEIAELFCEKNEEIEKVEENVKNYYSPW